MNFIMINSRIVSIKCVIGVCSKLLQSMCYFSGFCSSQEGLETSHLTPT